MSNARLTQFEAWLAEVPLIAILRGLPGDDAIAVVEALFDAGVRLAEVPLNSPAPFDTITRLARHFEGRMLIGAGTVVAATDVARLAEGGCAFIVSPNTDAAVISATLAHGMVPVPGFSSPSEAFAAIAAGARHLKAFPAHQARERLAALSVVLPADVTLLAVGGVAHEELDGLWQAGVRGVGVGSDVYRPGRDATEVGARARAWTQALQRRTASPATLLCNPQALVGESPLVMDDQVLWVDPTRPSLLRWDGQACTRTALPEPVWALGLVDGQLVGNGEEHFVRLDAAGQVQAGPRIEVGPGCRLNDLVIDPRNGLWGGSMHRGLLAGKGALFYAPSVDQPARKVAEGLGVANGMAFSADGGTLYVIDTLARTLLAYAVDIEHGRLEEPRVVTDFLGVPGKPDGMARAPDGRLWVAMWGGDAVVELAENGAVLRSVAVPAHHVGSLCFGEDGRLFVTTARARLSPQALERAPGSGGLFVIAP
ncbi:2-dehydro-3-deoxy-6-phosphogalactonate aldolase [Pseudoxanthomonas sp.]|uniref:2-dehydro-3-deoxy-6-phosphogalactonate aldolase n=1 Tax=Pseudoxanthomonas sp. TaxID=1871049 RepID=UPI00260E7F43|nr:2-dehydro-3-deoxy-6-phosphogalactonate aldolase [Pseudoxanthomonas sp.]WDS37788.1 MAG: 2-dehydro-3-deoxy-6-phosphogalactonate aldolase [Pseudoxanthomonas sp.]